MRVKLSYTAEIDEVPIEAALLLGNLADMFLESIELYREMIGDLNDEELNSDKFYKNMATLRGNLGKIDARCLEVEQVISGLGDYHQRMRQLASQKPEPEEPPHGAAETVENDVKDD